MLLSLHETVIRFDGSILGFEGYDEFSIMVVEEDSPYAYLQSLQDENIGFLVVTPFVFHPDYVFELEEKDKTLLALESQEEVIVLNTVTIKEDFTKSTINLLAPLILNITTHQARQIVLPPNTNYKTTVPLFKEEPVESGE